MSDLTRQQIKFLAHIHGIEIVDTRSEAVGARLGRILDELNRVPDELLVDLEPVTNIVVKSGAQDD